MTEPRSMTEAPTVPRLRMFAGPNGSGKSRIKSVLRPELLGVYINPDDIERDIRQSGAFRFSDFGVEASNGEIETFFALSSLICRAGLADTAAQLRLRNGELLFDGVEVNSYFAAVLADFLRQKLVAARRSFTFETVMSSSDKIDLLRNAQNAGFRTYLYYVATQDPLINIARVANRVQLGGHDVPRNKIISRYFRSLDLLFNAIAVSNRAFLFDNSGESPVLLAQVRDGSRTKIETKDELPRWFQTAVLDKMQLNTP